MSLYSQFKRSMSHNMIKLVKLDHAPGYNIEQGKGDVNHSNKPGRSKHQTKSMSYKIKEIQKNQYSSQSDSVKKARVQLEKAQRELQQATMDYKKKNMLLEKGVTEQSPNISIYAKMVETSFLRQSELRKIVQRKQNNLIQLLNERKW